MSVEIGKLPLLPVELFRRTVEKLGGCVDVGPAGDWFITAADGRGWGPTFPHREHFTPGVAFETCHACGWELLNFYDTAKKLDAPIPPVTPTTAPTVSTAPTATGGGQPDAADTRTS